MKVKVYCGSRKGGNRKIADFLSKALDCKIDQLPPSYPPENEKIIFVGTGVAFGKPYKEVLDFARTVDSKRAKNAALFCASPNGSADLSDIRKTLEHNGVNVVKNEYICACPGFMKNGNSPTDTELEAALEWANKCIEEVTAQ